jgi:hypothetical protein
MRCRSLSDLNETIISNLHNLPQDIELVAGIPRSGHSDCKPLEPCR